MCHRRSPCPWFETELYSFRLILCQMIRQGYVSLWDRTLQARVIPWRTRNETASGSYHLEPTELGLQGSFFFATEPYSQNTIRFVAAQNANSRPVWFRLGTEPILR